MAINWASLGRQPHTYLLLLGTAMGYGLLITFAGSRPVVWLGGSAVATAMAGSWVMGYQTSPRADSDDSDLLNLESFQRRIETIQAQVPRQGAPTWQPVKTWALKSHQFADRIRDRDPQLHSELIEALYTVVNLAQQVAEGLQVQSQVQTPMYQQMAQTKVKQSCDRMEQTYLQLQQLQDQVALASLSQGGTSLPKRLETLIAANKEILES